MPKRLGAALAALLAVLVILAAIFHDGAARFFLSSVGVTGYRVRTSELHFGPDRAVLAGVHVTRGGQPVLDAERIEIDYNLRDLLPGSKHRFGLLAVTVDRPRLTIIRNANGTYNIALPPPGAPPAYRPAYTPVPLAMTIRVRDASARVIDPYRYYKASRAQSLDRIDADVGINTEKVTRYAVTGDLENAGAQPFRIAGSIDSLHGFALHHISLRSMPISTIANYFIDSPAAHILGGTVRDLDVRMYAFGVKPNAPVQYHLSGAGTLREAAMEVSSLDAPIRHINGQLGIFDGGFAAERLTAVAGAIPIAFAGGIFDFAHPKFRLGVQGSADLRDLKDVARFAAKLPIGGRVNFRSLIEGSIDRPLLLIGFTGKRFNYQAIPIDDPRGSVALLAGNLIVLPFHASYNGIGLHIQGNLALGDRIVSTLWLHAIGPSSRVPYLGALISNQPMRIEALLNGTDLKIRARGYLASLTQPRNVNGFYEIDENGTGAFGPILIRTPAGGDLVAGFNLDRPHGNSLFWVSAHDIRLNQPNPIAMPGVNIPQLPPMDAHVVEANIAATGSAANVVIGGSAYMNDSTISGVPFASIGARFAGPFANADISRIHADGPWGTFDGNGSFAPTAIVARGNYSGTLQGLRNFIGNFPLQGRIHGPMSIALAQGKIFVQAKNAQLHDATIHGIPVRAISGTMRYDNGILHVYSAQAQAAGGTVVAAGSFGTIPNAPPTRMALATTSLNAAALQGLGLPLQRGSLRAVGAIMPGNVVPALDAGVVLQNGSAQGYGPFATSADVAIRNDAVHFQNAVASLGSTYANVTGSVDGLAAGVPRYDVTAEVPAGRISSVAQIARVPTYNADGSFEGRVRIGGSASDPTVHGNIAVPVGEVNGLGFDQAQGEISMSSAGASVRHGAVRVGNTIANFSATVAKSETAFAMRSRHADLTDFNDYFDTGDTLGGSGYLSIAFTQYDRLAYTSGDIDIDGLRYRSLPIGDTDAKWTSLRDVVHETLSVGGEHGRLQAKGTIALTPRSALGDLVMRSRYNVNLSLRGLDLTTWLPALGFGQAPVTGRVDGDAHMVGSFPHLGLTGTASVRAGTLGPLPIERGELALRSDGDRIDVTRAVIELPALQATGSGSFGFSPTSPLQLTVQAKTDDLPRLIAELSKKRIDVRGPLETTLNLGGTIKAPQVTAGIDGTGLTVYGVKIPSLVGLVRVQRKSLVISNAEIAFERGRLTLAGSMPLQLQPLTFGPMTAPISMDLTADGLDLSTFGNFLGNNTKLGGRLDGHLGVSGTVLSPRIVGQVGINGLTYVSALETVPITQTVAQLTFHGTGATLDRLNARLGNGRLDGTGTLSFGSGLNGGPLGYALSIATRSAQVNMPQLGAATFDSTLQLQRVPGNLAQLAGKVDIARASIPFSSFLAFGGAGAAAGAGPPFNLGLNLEINASRNVSVRGGGYGFGMDISGRGAAHLSGTLVHPTLDGTFSSTGGTLTFVDRAFRLQQAEVAFDPADGVLPSIYAVGTTHVTNPDPDRGRNPTGSADITITVSGRVNPSSATGAMGLKTTLSSSPSGYTDQQLIAMLLPLSGLVGPVQFTETGAVLPPGQLAGAPAAGTGAPLPANVLVRENGTLTVGQEAFNILNAQFATGLLSPIESALGSSLGLSNVNLTLDYTGNFGIDFRRILARDFYGVYGTTFGVPVRQTVGFAYQPNAFTSAQLTLWFQQGPTPLFLAPNQTISTNPRAASGQALQGENGFTFLFQRLF